MRNSFFQSFFSETLDPSSLEPVRYVNHITILTIALTHLACGKTPDNSPRIDPTLPSTITPSRTTPSETSYFPAVPNTSTHLTRGIPSRGVPLRTRARQGGDQHRNQETHQIDLIAFYRGQTPDSEGRTIQEIRAFSLQTLEDSHNFIQWIFPTIQRSQHNSNAPRLTPEWIQQFRTQADLRTELRASLNVMLNFYGFNPILLTEEAHLQIVRSPHYAHRSRNWITVGNHNFLRITRILNCLNLLELEQESLAFSRALQEVYQENQNIIGIATFQYWQRAAGAIPENP